MGFTIEELINEIINADLDNEEKTRVLSKLFRKGQLQDEVFVLKNDGEDSFKCWRRQTNKNNGRTELVEAASTAEDAIIAYQLELYNKERAK